MVDDIVPKLLEQIQSEFDNRRKSSSILKNAILSLERGKATYKDVNAISIEIGEILSSVFKDNISADVLPDGKMYFNIAERILGSTFKKNYDIITTYGKDVQDLLNEQAKIRLKPKIPKFNQDRMMGIVNRLSSESSYDDISWILDDPVVTFSQSIVDDLIKENVEFHARSGLNPQIVRKASGHCCDWCQKLVGSWTYKDEPKNVYHRHGNCRCTVDYIPQRGKKQNVWNKKWNSEVELDKIEARKTLNLSSVDIPKSISAKARNIYVKYEYPVRGESSIKEGSSIRFVNIIAGKGVNRKIDDIERLIREYPGGKRNSWQKMTGIAELSDNRIAEVHWYQSEHVGKVEFKVKRWIK